MNSMEGSQTIPAYVEYENALIFGSGAAKIGNPVKSILAAR